MPAHQTTASVGERKLSNGTRLSMVDWRANRLADGLAKQSAAETRASLRCRRLLVAAVPAVKHAATLLGRITHGANNLVTYECGQDGRQVKVVKRDATQAEVRRKRKASPRSVGTAQNPPTAVLPVVGTSSVALPPPLKCPRRSRATGRPSSSSRSTDDDLLRRRMGEIGATLAAPVGKPSAAERLAALRARLASSKQQ